MRGFDRSRRIPSVPTLGACAIALLLAVGACSAVAASPSSDGPASPSGRGPSAAPALASEPVMASASAPALKFSAPALPHTLKPLVTPKPTLHVVGLVSAPILVSLHGFRSTGAMPETRSWHTGTLLTSGKVLIVGGNSPSEMMHAQKTALLYDPADSAFHATGSMTYARSSHTATRLNNGKVLVVGGTDNGVLPGPAELYNSATGTFSLTGSLHTPRVAAGAVKLTDGRVLVVGGSGSYGARLASAEIYDPSTGLFTVTGSMTGPRSEPRLTLLASGRVLVSGGDGAAWELKTAEIFDPATGHFTATGSMTTERYWHTSTLLGNGKVLVVAGEVGGMELNSVNLYDPATGHFTVANPLHTARIDHVAVLLNDGRVLVTGGFAPGAPPSHPLALSELYLPTTGTWVATGSMVTARERPTATLLLDGRVLVTGGLCEGGQDAACAVAEIYS